MAMKTMAVVWQVSDLLSSSRKPTIRRTPRDRMTNLPIDNKIPEMLTLMVIFLWMRTRLSWLSDGPLLSPIFVHEFEGAIVSTIAISSTVLESQVTSSAAKAAFSKFIQITLVPLSPLQKLSFLSAATTAAACLVSNCLNLAGVEKNRN